MNKKNLFITFPVDAGMTTWERNYKKFFSDTTNFESFSFGDRENINLYNKQIRLKRFRILASIKLRKKIKHYSKRGEKIIFQGLSPAIYTYGSYKLENTVMFLDGTRALTEYVRNKKPKKDLAYHVHKFILKRIPRILCVSHLLIEMLNEFYDIPKKNLFKVPPPLLSSKFTMYPRKTPSKPNVLFIGRLFKLKGGEVILKNLDKFINNCKLTMVTNDEKANIKGIKYFNNNLSDEEILNLYKTNDILILPCFFDTFGAVIAEASSAGLAVITTKFVIGSKDIIVNNKTGIITDTQEQCIDELVKLIKNPQKIDDFKIAGYNKIQSEFTESKIYNEYKHILEQS
jgi:glycosyltransferase involved in cell wall biosynthesis